MAIPTWVTALQIRMREFRNGSAFPPEKGQALQAVRDRASDLAEQSGAQTHRLGGVCLGDLRRLEPISRTWGFDRGQPIDRYYIDNFLAAHACDIQGQVLEVGDGAYTQRFGNNRVTHSDVLHVVEGNPQATIVGDLVSADHIPSNKFDCVILTQTLQLIYDCRSAIKTLNRILKPGGVLLATFPGISQTYDNEWGNTWYWNFTSVSAHRLFEEVFAKENVGIEAFGNVLSAIAFLHGLAVEELGTEELDHRDPGYEVTITVRAVKSPPAIGPRSNAGLLRTGESSDSKAIILMYHRVIEACSDPWGLCITPGKFAQQLEVLQKHAQVIRLQELVNAVQNRGFSHPSVVVTFDDGYADNLFNAKPILERYDIPATVFVATGYIGGLREFWWDELEKLLIRPGVLPQTLCLDVNGKRQEWDLGEAANYSEECWLKDRTWKASAKPPSARQALYVSIWHTLQPLQESARQAAMNELFAWAGAKADVRMDYRTLAHDELTAFGRDRLIEIGAHTATHPLLPVLPVHLQRDEIVRSKRAVEEIIGREIVSFAYPYGAYTPEVIPIVQNAGFNCACSTVESVVDKYSERFELPRIGVQDWDGDEFGRRLQAWLTG